MSLKQYIINFLDLISIFKVRFLTENDYKQMENTLLETNIILGTNIKSIAGAILSWASSGPTHAMYYDAKTNMIYHSITKKGVNKEPALDVIKRYNKIELRKSNLPISIEPETLLGKEYDWEYDYEDSSKINCVEYLNIIFGIKDCKIPKDLRKYSKLIKIYGSNMVYMNMGDKIDE